MHSLNAMRRPHGLPALLVTGLACGACASMLKSKATAKTSAVPVTSATVPATTSKDPNSGPPTTIVTYPDPYAPSYDRLASLVKDSDI